MSSWLRTAVNRAVDKDHLLRRTIQSYAGSVVVHAGNAVAGSARILHDRIGFRNLQGFKSTVKRLEEVSISCRGSERVQLLRRWLVSLKQVDNSRGGGFDEFSDSPPQSSTLVQYVDNSGDEPKNFCDVFLYSQALEGITLSMILEAPNKEEVSLVLELYGLCLTGGKEVHNEVMRKVQDLAETFSGYKEEVLIKRQELLQFAKGAIGGLKINANIPRIDAEVNSIKEKLGQTNLSSNEGGYDETALEGEIDLEQTLTEIQLCYKLEAILLKKKTLTNRESREIHDEKVYKLKILMESLSCSTSKAEKRILDHRSQQQEALSFRAAKTGEVHQAEKDLEAEIKQLETKRDELEDELRKVNTLLASARKHLQNTREQRDQFHEASDQILVHLKTKEDELLRSLEYCRTETEVVDCWINFLEDTWSLQTSCTKQKEKQIMDDLERLGDHFRSLVINILSTYEKKLGPFVVRTRKLVEGLRTSKGSEIQLVEEDDKSSKVMKTRKDVEEECLDVEAKFLTTMSIMDSMKKQFYVRSEGIFRKDDEKIEELFEAFEKLTHEFESIEKPTFETETTPTKKSDSLTLMNNESKTLNDIELIITELESEFHSDGLSDLGEEDINDWEFDALERD